MKKRFLILSFLFLSTSVFANPRIVTITTGLISGVPFYSAENIKEINTALTNNHRVIIGADFYVNLNPTEITTFFAGTDLLADYNNVSPYYSNHLSLDFPFGIKVYPKLLGLNFSLAYNMGFRTDYYNTEADGKYGDQSMWGNGFKFAVEYDFSRNILPHLPSVGLYWKHMPRGNNTYDNHICAYVNANL